MFEAYFTAQVCCQLLLYAKQNNHKFFFSHVEAWMDDYTRNGEGLHRVQQLLYTLIYTMLSITWMNNKNNTSIILRFKYIEVYAELLPQSNLFFSLPMEWENEIYSKNNSPSSGYEKAKVSQNTLLT